MNKMLLLSGLLIMHSLMKADIVEPVNRFIPKYSPAIQISGTEKFKDYDWSIKMYHREELVYDEAIDADPFSLPIPYKDRFITGVLEAKNISTEEIITSEVFSISAIGEHIAVKKIKSHVIKIKKKDPVRLRLTAMHNQGPVLPLGLLSAASLAGILIIQRKRKRTVRA